MLTKQDRLHHYNGIETLLDVFRILFRLTFEIQEALFEEDFLYGSCGYGPAKGPQDVGRLRGRIGMIIRVRFFATSLNRN